jgi:hypothetical protein
MGFYKMQGKELIRIIGWNVEEIKFTVDIIP